MEQLHGIIESTDVIREITTNTLLSGKQRKPHLSKESRAEIATQINFLETILQEFNDAWKTKISAEDPTKELELEDLILSLKKLLLDIKKDIYGDKFKTAKDKGEHIIAQLEDFCSYSNSLNNFIIISSPTKIEDDKLEILIKQSPNLFHIVANGECYSFENKKEFEKKQANLIEKDIDVRIHFPEYLFDNVLKTIIFTSSKRKTSKLFWGKRVIKVHELIIYTGD